MWWGVHQIWQMRYVTTGGGVFDSSLCPFLPRESEMLGYFGPFRLDCGEFTHFWCLFYRPKSVVMYQNWQISGCKWEDFVARFKRNPKLKKELKKCSWLTKILQIILNLYKTFTQCIMTSSNILSFVLRLKRIISQKLLFRYKTLDESIGSGNYVVKAYEGIGPLGAGGGWVIQVIHHISETSNTNNP